MPGEVSHQYLDEASQLADPTRVQWWPRWPVTVQEGRLIQAERLMVVTTAGRGTITTSAAPSPSPTAAAWTPSPPSGRFRGSSARSVTSTPDGCSLTRRRGPQLCALVGAVVPGGEAARSACLAPALSPHRHEPMVTKKCIHAVVLIEAVGPRQQIIERLTQLGASNLS